MLCVTSNVVTRCIKVSNIAFVRAQRDAHEKFEDRLTRSSSSRHKAVELEEFLAPPALPSLHAYAEGDFVWVRSLRFDHRQAEHATKNPSAHLGRVLRAAGEGRYEVQRMWAKATRDASEPTCYQQQIGSFLVQEQLLSLITTTIKFNMAKLAWLPRVALKVSASRLPLHFVRILLTI